MSQGQEEGGGAIVLLVMVLFILYWAIKIGLIILVLLLGLIMLSIIPVFLGWLFYQTFQALIQNKTPKRKAIILPSLTVLTGLGIGCLILGFTSPLMICGLVAVSIPLATLLIYPSIHRRKLIKKYQEREKHLIAP